MRITRRIAVAFTCLALLPAPPAGAATGTSSVESRVLSLINAGRSWAGRTSLAPHGRLRSEARSHSAAMARSGRLTHSGFPARIRSAMGRDAVACENVARFRPAEPVSADQVARTIYGLWYRSSSHKRCMLDLSRKGYTLAGLGVYRDARGGWWATLEAARG